MVKTYTKSLWICMGYLRRQTREPKCILTVILVLIFTNVYTEEILNFAGTTDYGITPWIGVFFTTTRFPRLIMQILFLLLISDLPFRKRNDMFFLLRSGRRAFCVGNLLFVWISAAIFSICVVFCSGIWGIGHMEWSMKWGKIIGTLALTDAGDAFTHSVGVSTRLVSKQEPLFCALTAFFLFLFCNILLGQVYICCNLLSQGKNRGIILCGALLLWDFMIQSDPVLWKFAYASPISWSNLTCLDLTWNVTQFPSLAYAWAMYLFCNTALAVTALLLSKRIRICEEQ